MASQIVVADDNKESVQEPGFSTEEHKSVLYIYRDKMVTASTVPYHCYLNDEFISVLINGQYHRHVVVPGQYDYWVEMISVDSNRIVSRSYQLLDLQAGKIYFIKHLTHIGARVMSWEVIIDFPDEYLAKEEIKHLSPDK